MNTRRFSRGVQAATVLFVFAGFFPACAHADETAYLVNLTVRPGYRFTNPQQALNYGYRLCDVLTAGTGYGPLIGMVKTDELTTDDYQAAYLINQAVNELCPSQIWQLRQSAAGYRPASGKS